MSRHLHLALVGLLLAGSFAATPLGVLDDTTAPVVSDLSAPDPGHNWRVRVDAVVTDEGGIVAGATAFVDGVEGRRVRAVDGAFDEASEEVFVRVGRFEPETTHEVCIVGIDVAGNESDGTGCIEFSVVDRRGPRMHELAVGPSEAAVGQVVRVTGTTDDTRGRGGSDVVDVAWTLDGEELDLDEIAQPGKTAAIDAQFEAPLAQGEHELCGRAFDEWGNRGPRACTTFTTVGRSADGAGTIASLATPGLGEAVVTVDLNETNGRAVGGFLYEDTGVTFVGTRSEEVTFVGGFADPRTLTLAGRGTLNATVTCDYVLVVADGSDPAADGAEPGVDSVELEITACDGIGDLVAGGGELTSGDLQLRS